MMKRQPAIFVCRAIIMGLAITGSVMFLQTGSSLAHAAPLNGRMNTAVYDVTHGRYYTYNASAYFIMGSSMKVPILLTFFDMIEQQGREPTSSEMNLLTTMIENSNNNSASILYYNKIGGATGVTSFLQRIGIAGLYPNAKAWGYSLVTPWAMVNLLARLYEGSILTAYDRYLAFYLMENVERDQRWGVGDTAPEGTTVAMKDGWLTGPNGLWSVNSSGIVMSGGETYIIAAYTQDESSLASGKAAVEEICSRVASQLF